MEQHKSAWGAVVLSRFWIYGATALILLQAAALVFVGLNLSHFVTQCPCPGSPTDVLQGSTITLKSGAQTTRADRKQREECFMGGIIPRSHVFPRDANELHTVSHVYGASEWFYPEGFTSFSELLCMSRSDKQTHWFGHMYGEYLDPLRLQQGEVNMLEIGLRYGDSLDLWLSAFPKGKIYGLDAFHTDVTMNMDKSMLGRRITVFKGDQESVAVLTRLVKHVKAEVGFLDFIIDDGGHTMGQQITSLTHLFPLVRPGGFYFIEDLQTSYWEKKCHLYFNGEPYCYGGGPPGAKNTTIDLLKSLIDVMNSDFMEDHPNTGDLGSGVYRVNSMDGLVGSIQCWRNMCVLRRKFDPSFF